MILLLINKYKGLLATYGPTVVIGTIIQILLPKNNLDSTFFYIFVGVFVILLLRHAVDRFNLVKEQDRKFVVPAILVIIAVGLLIGTMFSDYLADLMGGLVSVLFVLNPDPVGYTVAEQQPGSINTLVQLSSLQFGAQLLPQLNFITPYITIWGFVLAGILVILYRMIRRRDFALLLPLVWIIASIWGVFLFIRLSFLFGPPAALVAGLFVAWGIKKVLELGKREQLIRVRRYIPVVLLIIAAVVVVTNSANAYVYTNGLGPSICIINSQILIDGQRCLDVDRDGKITFAEGQPWYEAFAFLQTIPEPKNLISWWDFGHWFHSRGGTPSVADGGRGPRVPIALWYTDTVDNWDKHMSFVLERHKVTHILQDFTLPGKYGAISAIATNGKGTVGLQQFNQGQTFNQGNTTIQEYTSGQFALWIPVQSNGNLAGSPMLLVSQGGQFVQQGFINDVCTPDGIVHTGDRNPSIGGCVTISPFGVFYVPEQAKNTIFVSLQLMNGAGLPVETIFDNRFIKVYRITGNETA